VPASAAQARELTDIAFAAKRHWGYPDTWFEHWREALTITPSYLSAAMTFAAVLGGASVGFASTRIDGLDAWLDHLWVLPLHVRRGVGRRLFAQVEAHAQANGATRLCLEADPHAEGFYLRMGLQTVDHLPVPMDGVERFLAVMEKRLR